MTHLQEVRLVPRMFIAACAASLLYVPPLAALSASITALDFLLAAGFRTASITASQADWTAASTALISNGTRLTLADRVPTFHVHLLYHDASGRTTLTLNINHLLLNHDTPGFID